MKELLEASISLVNIIPTTLLVFVLIYWIIVLLGLIDMDAIDVDHDINALHEVHTAPLHMHMELAGKDMAVKEIPVATDTSAGSFSWLHSTLAFFNVGKIPFMVLLSFLILPIWALSVLANHYLNNESVLLALLLLIPNLFLSVFIAKLLTMPLVKVFSYLHKDVDQQPIVGQVCTVLLTASAEKLGQAVINNKGNTILLNVKPADGHRLDKGKKAIVLEFNKDKQYYLIQSFDI